MRSLRYAESSAINVTLGNKLCPEINWTYSLQPQSNVMISAANLLTEDPSGAMSRDL